MKIEKAVIIALLIIYIPMSALAQELTGLAGALHSSTTHETTYSWQMEYLEGLGEHFAYSITYLNEGHLTDHHRDGEAILAWGRTTFFNRQLGLGIGVGPYFYYDTQKAESSYNNAHGWGAMTSYTLTWYTTERIYFQMRMNWIITSGNIDTRSLLVGIGYQLEPPPVPGPLTSFSSQQLDPLKNEVTLFLGETILNSFGSEQALAFSIEYRRHIYKYLDWTFSYLYEGENDDFRRNGLVSQLWLVRSFFDNHFSLGFGAGAYATLDYHNAAHTNDDRDFLSGIVTLSTSYLFHPHWGIRLSWNRIVTGYSSDTDVILGGIGYHF